MNYGDMLEQVRVCQRMQHADWQYYTPTLPLASNPSKGNQEDAKVVKLEEKKH